MAGLLVLYDYARPPPIEQSTHHRNKAAPVNQVSDSFILNLVEGPDDRASGTVSSRKIIRGVSP